LTDILLDTWSLTSIDKVPGRMEVAPFLLGLTSDLPDTHVAWRREVSILHEAVQTRRRLRDWFRACRIEARERLRDRTARVKKTLRGLLGSLQKKDDSLDLPVGLLDERGGAAWCPAVVLASSDTNLAYRTVVLPVAAAAWTATACSTPRRPLCLALSWMWPRTIQLTDGANAGSIAARQMVNRYERLGSGELADTLPEDLREKERIPLREAEEGAAESESLDLVLVVSPAQSRWRTRRRPSARQTLAVHTRAIVSHMSRIAERLASKTSCGPRWRRSALARQGKAALSGSATRANAGGGEVLAKATRYLHPRALGGYRHEFRVAARCNERCRPPSASDRELVLPLIGRTRLGAAPL
jgi:hypothetical protein